MPAAKTFPLSLVLTAVDKITAVTRKVDKSLVRVGQSVTNVGTKMTAGLSVPIVGIGAAATKGFADFEKGMASVSTLIDTNTENLGAMGEEVLRIGRETPVAVEDLTGALFDVRSAGVSAADQFTVLEGSAKLAVAGLGTTKQAVDLVTSATNAFQLEGEDATKVFDNIFKATKFGKTTISELAQGFGAVAGQVAASGTKLDEYLASVAALTTTGNPASQAHTQLRAVISGLTRDTDKTRKVFRGLGAKDLPDLIAKSGGLVPALQRISDRLGGNQQKILGLVGSSEAMNAILGLTGAQAGKFGKALDDMRNGSEAMTEAFDKQNKTLTASWQRTKNTLLSAGMVIGQAVAPVIQQLAGAIQSLANWFRGLDKDTQAWIIRIAAAAAALGPLLVIVGKAITFAGLLAKGLGFVATAIRVITGALLSNPIGALVGLIATAAFLIIENWEPISEFFKILWDEIKDIFKSAWEFIEPIVGRIVGAAKGIQKAGSFVADLIVSDVPGQSIEEGRRLHGLPPPRTRDREGRTRLKVDITGAPRGTRAEVDPQSDADVDMSVGFQMGTP